MSMAGGLRLALEAATAGDRRVRFARLSVSRVDDEREIPLVTDARGRLRYRLSPGEYRLRLDEAVETWFAVGDAGWTTVRVRLPSA